jgi:hypothetical protein
MAVMQTRIREILLRQWDPIGVTDLPQAQDEYDSYVGEIANAIRARRPVSAVADQLLSIETARMGLPSDRGRALRVANALLHLLPH